MAGRLNRAFLTSSTSNLQDELGALVKDAYGRVYRYVKSAAVNVKYDAVHISSTANTTGAQGGGWRVARAASAENARRALGACIAALSSSTYGYVQCGGPLGTLGGLKTGIKTNKSVVAGDIFYKSGVTAAMTVKAPATGSTAGFNLGLALGSDSGSFLVAGILFNRFGGAS